MIKQKVNKWGAYWTPKILIISGIILILFGESINNYIIGSIIISSTGMVYFLFPLIGNIKKNKVLHVRFGSLLIIIAGIGWILYFLELVPYIIFNHICNYIYFLILFFFCISGTLMQKYNVFHFLNMHQLIFISNKEYEQCKYSDDNKNIKLQNNLIVDWTFWYDNDIKKIENNQELKILYIRNDIELFIHTLLWVCFFNSILYSILLEHMSRHRFLFEFLAGFLIISYPNAIDVVRIKYSRLFTRLAGMMFLLGTGSFFLLQYGSVNPLAAIILFFIGGLMYMFGIMFLCIIYMRLDPKKVLKYNFS